MPTMDQVVWASVNVHAGGEPQCYKRGDLLPEASSSEEMAQRQLLRQGGALRIVEVVYTAEELADMARARGEATAAREAAADIDPNVPVAEQVTQPDPGLPVLREPSGSPVVIGDEDLRAAHQQQARDAGQTRETQAREDKEGQPKPPAASAAKSAWVDHAVDVHGADRAEAEKMSRDQLAAKYAGAPAGGTAAGKGPQPQAAPQPPPSSGTDSPAPQPDQPGLSRGGKQGS